MKGWVWRRRVDALGVARQRVLSAPTSTIASSLPMPAATQACCCRWRCSARRSGCVHAGCATAAPPHLRGLGVLVSADVEARQHLHVRHLRVRQCVCAHVCVCVCVHAHMCVQGGRAGGCGAGRWPARLARQPDPGPPPHQGCRDKLRNRHAGVLRPPRAHNPTLLASAAPLPHLAGRQRAHAGAAGRAQQAPCPDEVTL